MPKGVSEISQGNQFSRSANEGQLADAATRTFRIILNTPDEVFDIQQTCQVFVGDQHPVNTNLFCASFDCKYEGDTRVVLVATFNYQSAASQADSTASGGGPSGGGGGGSRTQAPNIRPANWSISTELIEAPATHWTLRVGQAAWGGATKPVNPARDPYEGISTLIPIVNIKVTQFVMGGGFGDPTAHAAYVGSVNSTQMQIGSLVAEPHTLMFRGLSSTPVVESFASYIYRGWNVEYTFALKNQKSIVSFAGGDPANDENEINLGWDAAIIVEGRNVICFNPQAPLAWQYTDGQPLKVGDDKNVLDVNDKKLPEGLAPGDKAPAMVKIQGFGSRGYAQAPAAEPVAINLDGTPRLPSAQPIVRAYQLYPAIDMISVLNLRLT